MSSRALIAGAIGLIICAVIIGIFSQAKKGRQNTAMQPEAEALYQQALSWESKGELAKAREVYQELIKQFPDYKQISELQNKLWDLSIKVLFSPQPSEKDIVYKVEPNDTLGKIAAKYNTTVDLVKRSNKLEGNLIWPGNRLKISTAKYSVIVDKTQSTLTLQADEQIIKVYRVATGKYGCTPVGTFTIKEKLLDPDWYKGGEGIILAEDPKNVLGTRWLGFSEPQYGIHGGANQEDLGQQLTNGCVRMTNADVEELFTILPRGTEVTVVE